MKMTHRIVITMLSHAEAVDGIMRKAVKLLRNSGLECEAMVVAPHTTQPKPFAESIHSMVDITDADVEAQIQSERRAIQLIPAPAHNPEPSTIYIVTSGASVFYGFQLYDGKGLNVNRITVSGLHPHYSNPSEVAAQLESTFRALGHPVHTSVYSDSKVQ